MMEIKDKLVLSKLVVDYGLKNVISALASVASDQADHFNDLQLKDKAIEFAEMSDVLRDLLVE